LGPPLEHPNPEQTYMCDDKAVHNATHDEEDEEYVCPIQAH
jgi:hypothetical protein